MVNRMRQRNVDELAIGKDALHLAPEARVDAVVVAYVQEAAPRPASRAGFFPCRCGVALIWRPAERRGASSPHVACATSLGGSCARTRTNVRFLERAGF